MKPTIIQRLAATGCSVVAKIAETENGTIMPDTAMKRIDVIALEP